LKSFHDQATAVDKNCACVQQNRCKKGNFDVQQGHTLVTSLAGINLEQLAQSLGDADFVAAVCAVVPVTIETSSPSLKPAK
jgi:pyrroline-5-carboxylate reductase